PLPTLFPYTTLFRSRYAIEDEVQVVVREKGQLRVAAETSNLVVELVPRPLEREDVVVVLLALPIAHVDRGEGRLVVDAREGERRSEEHTSELQSRGH